ncbi:MAG: hypothetical protein ACYS99_17105, partial [Planctomycetota bacterium]
MRTLAETSALLHRARPPLAGLEGRDALRALSWTEDVLGTLDRLHAGGALHGGVCPEAVRIGAGGARLAPPGAVVPPLEFRDPERERGRVRDGRDHPAAEPRHDLFGAGATLYSIFDGGPPPCGPASRFTRPAPGAVAYVVARAMADGPAR